MSILLPALLGMAAAQPDNQFTPPSQQARALIASYGECIVKREERLAAQAILADPGNGGIMSRYPRLVQPTCLSSRLGDAVRVEFSGDQFRFAIADALVQRQLASLPVPMLDAVPRLAHGDPIEPSPTDRSGRKLKESAYKQALYGFQEAQTSAYLSRFGECVIRVDPDAARALLMTEPASGEETARFAAMGMALATCLPEGRKLSLGKLALRGTIAVNYYRLAMAARSSRPGGEV